MYYTIYKITHLASGKIYIGKHQTSDPQDDYMGSGKLIRAAIEKHGVDQFRKDVLYVFDREEDMNAKEAELVTEEFCKQKTNYNLCPGGHGGWGYVNTNLPNGMLGKSQTDHQKNTARETLTAYAKSDLGRKNASKGDKRSFLGKSHSEETKEKMRKSKNVGESNSQFGTMWVTNGEEAKKIKTYEPIPVGWRKGRK